MIKRKNIRWQESVNNYSAKLKGIKNTMRSWSKRKADKEPLSESKR